MRLRTNIGRKIGRGIFRRLTASEKGAELLELAFVLPFLLVMIIGIIDFGGAWAAKDEVEGAGRSGARVAVANFNDTTNPQCGGNPCSVQVAVNAIVQNIDAANLPDCGMNASGIAAAGPAFTWSDSAACPNGGTFTITVARALPTVDDSTGTDVNVLATQVTISYPYTLQLSMAGGLIFSLGNFSNFVTLNTSTTMVNLN